MKISLLRVNNIPEMGEEKRLYAPPMGILYLASSLYRARLPVEISVLDMALSNVDSHGLQEYFQQEQPDLVGLSALSCEEGELACAASVAKQWRKETVVVVGGPHATMSRTDVLENNDVDFSVVGEAEETIVELVSALLDSRETSNIHGTCFRSNGSSHLAKLRPAPENLDALPFPAWNLIDIHAYQFRDSFHVLLHRIPYMSVQTSRGCPFQCNYCHHMFGKKVRQRSPESVVAEVEALQVGYGIKEIHFIDDIFNFDKKRAIETFRRLQERQVSIAFPNGLRGDLMDQEIIQEMKKAGVYAVNYAIESASERVQELIKKRLDIQRCHQAIAWSKEAGILTAGFFMMGFPTETVEEIQQTIDFAEKSELDRAHFFTVVPHRGTGLFELAREAYPSYEAQNDAQQTRYYFSERPFYQEVTGVNINQLQEEAYRRFYLKHPLRLLTFFWRMFMLWALRFIFAKFSSKRMPSVQRELESEPMSEVEEVEAYEILTRDHRTYDDDVISKKVVAMLPEDQPIRLVDVGCGTGRIAMRILRARPNVHLTCVDLSSPMLEQARKNFKAEASEMLDRVTFVEGDGKCLPFENGSFDFGFCCYVLHHLKMPEQMMREVARVTRPEGGLFFFDLQRKGGKLLELWVRIFTTGYTEPVRKLYRDSLKAALTLNQFKAAVLVAGIEGLKIGRRSFFDLLATREFRVS